MQMKKYTLISKPEKTIGLNELIPGDILCTHGNRWLSKKIQHFMKVQGHKWFKIHMWEWFNHMATWIDTEKQTIGEAIISGYNIHSIHKYYDENAINRMIVVRPKKKFTKEEQKNITAYSEHLDMLNKKYEYSNFLWWVLYIYTKGKIDLSPKGEKKDDRLFCFEAALMLWKFARKGWIDEEASKITTVSLLLRIDVELYRLQT